MTNLNSENVDVEFERYIDAYNLSQASLPVDNLLNKQKRFNPVSGRNDVVFRMGNGGYIKIGEEDLPPPLQPVVEETLAQPPQMMTEAMQQPEVATELPVSDIEIQGAQQFVEETLNEEQRRRGYIPTLEEFEAAGYSKEVVEAAGFGQPEISKTLTQEEIQQRLETGGIEIATTNPTIRGNAANKMSYYLTNIALQDLREELQAQGASERTIQETLRTRENELFGEAEVITNAIWGHKSGIGVADFTTAGILDLQEGYRLYEQSLYTGSNTDRVFGLLLMAAGVGGLGAVAKAVKRKLPAIRERLNQPGPMPTTSMFGAGEIDRGLAAAGRLVAPEDVKIGPPSDVPMVSQLQPQYRVTVENAPIIGTGKQSFIPKKMTPKNYDVASGNLQTLEAEFADPLASQENYALMMSRVQNATEVPAPPAWMIDHANDTDKWADWFKGLTESQIKAADDGLAIQEDFKAAYNSGAGPELTGQLMLWSILSRRMSAFPHEGGYLELAEAATPFIQKASRGEWTDADTEQWLAMVPTTIPQGTPGRSAISNANDFGKVFLKKMAAVDENGVSALSKLHDMIADPNMTSAEIRRAYYGLAEDTGIANKILSFALLVSGRNDVVVLDRIQINRMWAGGEKIYDDVYTQFEGAQGLAQYEALERSLASRIDELYAKAGRTDGSVGKYHWESWVLSSGQVVSHPTLKAVVGSGSPSKVANVKPTELTPVAEGRFHVKYSGVVYEKTPGGKNRYVYSTSDGTPYEFTKKQLDDMFKEVFKKKSGVLPDNFPGVSAFEGGNKPWYEFEGIDRGKFDAIIRQSGKSVSD